MPRWVFVGEPPRSFKVVLIVALSNFLVAAIAAGFRQYWSLTSPEGAFTYPIRFKGTGISYFRRHGAVLFK